MPVPHILNEADHSSDRSWWVILETEREREVEQQLRIRRSFDKRVQGLVDGERELAFYTRELAHETVVNPEPAAVAKRVAVGLLDGRPRRGADVRQEERRLDVTSDLTQIAIVPGRLDASEEGRRVDASTVPADAESVSIRRLDAEAGMEALVDQGVLWLVEQLLKGYRGARVSEPATHCLLLSFRKGVGP